MCALRIAADGDRAPPAGVIGQRTADEPTGAGEPFGDALDQPGAPRLLVTKPAIGEVGT